MATLHQTIDPLAAVDAAVDRASAALHRAQRDDGHWVFELEADCTIPAEYVLLRHYLGEPVDAGLEGKIELERPTIGNEGIDGIADVSA